MPARRPPTWLVAVALAYTLGCREDNPRFEGEAVGGRPASGGSGGSAGSVGRSNGSLVGHWRLDDGPGSSVAADSSGYAQPGALEGLDAAAAWIADRNGHVLKWSSGTTGGVRVQPAPALEALSNAFTISAWVFRDGATTEPYASVLSRQCGDLTSESYNVSLLGGDVVLFLNCGTGYLMVSASSVVPERAWVHLAITFESASARIYANGVLARMVTPSVRTIEQTAGKPIYIGNNKNGPESDQPHRGLIDDVAIWNRALTASEVSLLHRGTAPGDL